MDPKGVFVNRLDGLDEERFRAMLASPPFRLYLERLQAELERARADCERQPAAVELYRAQGTVAALRTALGLPEQILKDLLK
jgi:hypothetical protein